MQRFKVTLNNAAQVGHMTTHSNLSMYLVAQIQARAFHNYKTVSTSYIVFVGLFRTYAVSLYDCRRSPWPYR